MEQNQLDSYRLLHEVFAIIIQNSYPYEADIEAELDRTVLRMNEQPGTLMIGCVGYILSQRDMPPLVARLRLVCKLGRELTKPLFGAVMMIRHRSDDELLEAYARGLLDGSRLFIDAAICRSLEGLNFAVRLNLDMHFRHSLRQAVSIMFMHCWDKGLMTLETYETAMNEMEPCVYGCTFDSWGEAINWLMWDFDI